ncbi:hypothetical protein [Kutzneria kofuensis]|uniref:hypothetical protein n=1 Tax=Kutzneria kofuensis TaxID=103725 RepID=UPI0031EF3D57
MVAVGGGYGISKLVGGTTANASTQGPGGFGAGGGFGGGRGGGPGGMGGLFSALHGDFTVQDNGSYVTRATADRRDHCPSAPPRSPPRAPTATRRRTRSTPRPGSTRATSR